MEYCKECKNYEPRVWSCPSYDFEQEAYWKQYEKLYILGYQIFFEEGTTRGGEPANHGRGQGTYE